jgi:hypothetical protein
MEWISVDKLPPQTGAYLITDGRMIGKDTGRRPSDATQPSTGGGERSSAPAAMRLTVDR